MPKGQARELLLGLPAFRKPLGRLRVIEVWVLPGQHAD